MRQYIKKAKKSIVLMMAMILCLMPLEVLAAPTFGLSPSVSSVKPNATFTVSVGGSCVGRVNISVQNGSTSTSSVWVEEGYVSVSITAGSSGNVVVTATPVAGFSDLDGNEYAPGAKSVSVQIKAPEQPKPTTPANPTIPSQPTVSTSDPVHTSDSIADTRDGNSKLSNLQISFGMLSPEFNPDVTEYTVVVPSDMQSITITAVPQSEKATVTTMELDAVESDPKKIEVIVAAENETCTVYTINVEYKVIEKIQVGGKEHIIDESFTDEQIPQGFVRKKFQYKDKEYDGLVHKKSKVKLASLKNDFTTSFFVYNELEQAFYPYTQIEIKQNKYLIPIGLVDVSDFAEYEQTTIMIDDTKIEAWKLDKYFSVFRAINDKGEEVYYCYDALDKTIQRYRIPSVSNIPEIAEAISFINKNDLELHIALAALNILLLLIIIFGVTTRKARHSARKRKAKKQKKSKNFDLNP